ncbi:transcriptional regulator BetI [Marinomonas epiphytica]
MPKVGMDIIRKPQLIEATIKAIDDFGVAGATVSVIGKNASVSPAIINHYFGGKSGLFEETMKSLIREFFEDLQSQLQQTANSSSKAKVMAITKASFSQSQTRPKVVKAWIGFWAASMHTPGLFRLQRVYSRRLQTVLVVELKKDFELYKARNIASTLSALIDGMWLRGSLNGGIDKTTTLKQIYQYLELEYKEDVIHGSNSSSAVCL